MQLIKDMEFQEAKEDLKAKFTQIGFNLISDDNIKLVLKIPFVKEMFPGYTEIGYNLLIDKDDIENYIKLYPTIVKCKFTKSKCGIIHQKFLEYLVIPLNERKEFLYLPTINLGPIFSSGNQVNGSTYIEISETSELFFFKAILEPDFFPIIFHPQWILSRDPDDKQKALHQLNPFNRFYTISINNLLVENFQYLEQNLESVIDSILFNISYLNNLHYRRAYKPPFQRENSFPYENGRLVINPLVLAYEEQRKGQKSMEKDTNETNINPKLLIHPDLLRFYQLALSTDLPILQFLAYYQIIEYFFIRVMNENLYQKIAPLLKDPRFFPTPDNLDEIFNDVRNFKRESKESKQIEMVLKKWVTESELKQFISKFEKIAGKIYSKGQTYFGPRVLKIDLNGGNLFENLATIIYDIRNALVHSSDRYEGRERHIPFTDSSEIINKQIPMMRFVAEKIMIGSANSLTL